MSDINPENSGTEPIQPGFEVFGFREAILKGIDDAGFKVPSPIQKQAIPLVMEGRDLVGQAHTGTGKTAAFGLPGLNRLKQNAGVEMLVITPTRELATQVCEEIFRLGKHLHVKAVPVYGGQPYPRQIESIRRGAQVVVATPGRLLDLLKGGRLAEFIKPSLVVIDEADEMLDMGFIEDVRAILAFLPEERQTLLFSATMPGPVQELAEKFQKDPVVLRIDRKEPTVKDVQQKYYIIDEHERDDATLRLLDSMEPGRAIIFCRTKAEVDRLAGLLSARGVACQALHGDMEQAMRERVLGSFRKGEFLALIATDVAARGLDVPEVTHVFNYHIPFDTDSYVHRIGRTGRAGRKGVAVTLVTPREYHNLRRLQSKIGKLQHQLVPSHGELKKANERKLLDALRLQRVDQDAERFLQALEDEMGLAEAANKMAAMIMGQEAVTGPDQIGVHGSRLERLQNPKPSKTTGRKSSDRPPFGKRGKFEKPKFGKPDRFEKPAAYGKAPRAGKPAGAEKPGGGFSKFKRASEAEKQTDERKTRPQSSADPAKKRKFAKRELTDDFEPKPFYHKRKAEKAGQKKAKKKKKG